MDIYQLSLPGPTECDPEILNELNKPNIPHYGDLWLEYYLSTLHKLQQVYQTKNKVFIFPSSGSGAVETAFANLSGKKGLILENGTFGNRLTAIASHYLNKYSVITKNPGEPFKTQEIKKIVQREKPDLLAMVHGETSTGMLNPLEDIANVCQENKILFIVDAISTLGGAKLSVDKLKIDFCLSASQKALGSIPGLSTISVSPQGWKNISSEEKIPCWYFNLKTWQRYAEDWKDWHPFPITLPVHLFFALNKSLDFILEEGLEQRWLRHKNISKILHSALEEIGVSLLIKNKNYRLPTATSALLPNSLSSIELQNFLKNKYKILIAGGVGPLHEKVFRIGHMAYSAQEHFINRIMVGIKDYILNNKSISKNNIP